MGKLRREAGIVSVATSGGEGTQAVAFDQTFDSIPVVVLTLQEDPGAAKRGLIWVHTITTIGFTAEIDSDTAVNPIKMGWVAMEQRSSQKAAL